MVCDICLCSTFQGFLSLQSAKIYTIGKFLLCSVEGKLRKCSLKTAFLTRCKNFSFQFSKALYLLRWPTKAIHKYIFYYCNLYLISTQTYPSVVRVKISVQENIHQYNNMYPITEMLISVQKCKLHYRKISLILSTQITAPVQKNINLLVQKHKLQNKHIHCSARRHSSVQQNTYIQQYNNVYPSTEI